MQRIILIVMLSFFSAHSYSQGLYGFEGGIEKATISKSHITPAFEGYYLKRLSRSFYLGGAVSFQRYSFTYYNTSFTPANVNFGDILSVTQKSSYLFAFAKLDFGIGYRKYTHLNFAIGPGFFMRGEQLTNKFEPAWVAPSTGAYGRDTTAFATTNNIPLIIFQYRLGVSQRIPTLGFWNIMLSLSYNYIPGHISIGTPNLQTNSVSFTIGIMHKYPLAFVEY